MKKMSLQYLQILLGIIQNLCVFGDAAKVIIFLSYSFFWVTPRRLNSGPKERIQHLEHKSMFEINNIFLLTLSVPKKYISFKVNLYSRIYTPNVVNIHYVYQQFNDINHSRPKDKSD
jgi:hypothetical protein